MNKVCVYCGSSPGLGGGYLAAARTLGQELVRRGISLIYGGARIGLMGEVADAVLQDGGKVTGVLPRDLFRQEVPHAGLTELIEVASMHERKAIMAEQADAFIALPGGLGTIEELFEILTWSQLKLHNKPCGVLNIAGYYDKLEEFVDYAVTQEFIRPQHRDMILWADSASQLLDQFLEYEPPNETKWLELDKI
jgi:uncharacterized protein (TIGR00730 family)